jgi:2-methylcitrate dehydratase PrpD
MFVRRRVVDGVARMEITDVPRLRPWGAHRLSSRRHRRAVLRQLVRLGDKLVSHISATAKTAARAAATMASVAQRGGGGPPPDLQHAGWTFREEGSSVAPDPQWTGPTRTS